MKKEIFLLSIILFLTTTGFAQFDVANPDFIKSRGVPLIFTTGDFDGDGLKDIAYITEQGLILTILYQELDNTYTEVEAYASSTSNSGVYGLSSGDINKDGKMDIVLFDNGTISIDKLVVLKSTGREFDISKFQAPTTTTLSKRINVVDWDNDSNLDIVAICDSDPFQVYKGNGLGQFIRQAVTLIGSGLEMDLGYLNNDNQLDVVAINQKIISIYISNGTDFNKSDFSVSNFVSDVSIGDVSEDGLKDILLINSGNATENLVLLKNSITSIFTKEFIPAPVMLYRGLDIADFNNDGRMDILAGQFNNENGVILLKNTGSLNFTHESITKNYASLLFQLEFEDLDNDSKLEIVTMSASRRIDIFKPNAQYEYSLNHTKITGFHANQGTLGDLNKDGILDLVTSSYSNYAVVVHYGKPDYTFEKPIYFSTDGPVTAVALLDHNQDTYPDILYSCAYTSQSTAGIINSNGAGGLLQPAFFSPPFAAPHLILADMNGDQLTDLVVGNLIYVATSGGGYTQNIFSVPISTSGMILANINNDLFPDIVITDYTTVIYSLNDGNANFTSFTTLKNTGTSYNVAVGDLNSDSKADFIIPNGASNDVSIFYSTDTGFSETKISTSGYNAYNTLVDDFNNDNKSDFVVAHQDGTINYFIQIANNQFNRTSYKSNGADFLIAIDLNNDSKKDLITYSLNGNPIAILYNDSVIEPTQTATNPLISNRTDQSVTLTVTKGNGSGRMVIAREATQTGVTPTDGTFYSFNASFGLGAEVSTKNYVTYRGKEESMNIIGLKSNTEYILSIFEFDSNLKNTIINYEPSGISVQFKTKNTQTIAVSNIESKTVEDAPFLITASASSELPITIQLVSGGATLTNNSLTLNEAGPVKLLFSQSGNDDFMPAPSVEITFCINPATPAITYTTSTAGKYTLTSSSAINNIWLKNDVVIDGQTSKTIEVTPDATYKVKVDYSGCFSISQPVSPQVISFPDLTITADATGFKIVPTSNSSLEITYEVVSGGIEITNSVISILQPGPAKIKASQGGNNNFFPFPPIEIAFCVNPKKPTITTTNTGLGQYTLTSSDDINNLWFRNDIPISGATSKSYIPTQDGIYSVKVDYSGCFNTSLPTINLITGIEDSSELISLFPNPTSDRLFIEWPSQNPTLDRILILDPHGKQSVVNYNLIEGLITVDIHTLAPGFFTMILQTTKGSVVKKMIKE